jgi:superfamily II DNA or RNA helicase
MTDLRPYQNAFLAEFDQVIAAGKRRIIGVSPTGAGKTILAAQIINSARDRGHHVLVLAHTREIIRQTSAKLFEHNINHGIIQAGFMTRPDEPVQIASIQTLWTRAMRTNRMELPAADLLIIDEAHHCPANTYRKIIDAYPQAVLIGLTATPCRGDGRGLGGIFDIIVECPQVAELIEQKYLVRTRVFAPVEPDLKGVEDRFDWTLDPEKRSASPTHAARLERGYCQRMLECSQCGSIRIAGEACRHCGFLPQRPPKAIVFADGDLALVDRQRRTAPKISDPNERMQWHGMLTAIAIERSYKGGWISHKFREKFGTWPATRSAQPMQPTPEVLSWVRSRNIAYAKAKERAA